MHPYPSLASGARVALVAPAGPLSLPSDLDRARENARLFGFDAVLGKHVEERHFYFAGSDEHRLADLNRAIRDASIDAVWCLRGGYGAIRLLDGIDYEALRRRPKAIIGYSDITALHSAVAMKCGLSTIHGPTARSRLSAFAERSLRAAFTRDD